MKICGQVLALQKAMESDRIKQDSLVEGCQMIRKLFFKAFKSSPTCKNQQVMFSSIIERSSMIKILIPYLSWV